MNSLSLPCASPESCKSIDTLTMMQKQCPSGVPGAMVPGWVIPRPSPSDVAIFQNTNRDSIPFLRAVGIEEGSQEHKEFKTTIQALHHQYFHPFKYIEEQAPERVDQLVARAQISLPWLSKYEDGWPARIYLKRYVDAKRPHFMCSRYARRKQMRVQKPQASKKVPTRNLKDPGDVLREHDPTLREFLGSLAPSLEHQLDAFIELGVKDQQTLRAFCSWPQAVQAQFLSEGHGVLGLTSLEKMGLLVGCGLLVQRALEESPVSIVKPGCFRP